MSDAIDVALYALVFIGATGLGWELWCAFRVGRAMNKVAAHVLRRKL